MVRCFRLGRLHIHLHAWTSPVVAWRPLGLREYTIGAGPITLHVPCGEYDCRVGRYV
jgi:hypothetical protein